MRRGSPKKEIKKAVDVRDKLKVVFAAGGSVLNSFLEKEGSFEDAYERASAKGVDKVWFKRLHKLREFLINDDTTRNLPRWTWRTGKSASSR